MMVLCYSGSVLTFQQLVKNVSVDEDGFAEVSVSLCMVLYSCAHFNSGNVTVCI